MRVLIILGLGPLLAGQPQAADRSQVSTRVEQRTGYGLNPRLAPRSLTPQPFALPPGVSIAGGLTQDEAVAIALWNNAALDAAVSALGLARADLIEAGLLRNPSLQMLLPVGPKPFEFLLQAPIEAFWQRPKRVAAAKANLEAVAEALVQNGVDLTRDVRRAHADLWFARQRLGILREAAGLRTNIDQLTRKRLEAGDISEFDANLASIDARSAEDLSARAVRDAELAEERLRTFLGMRGDRTPLQPELKSVEPATDQPIDELIEAARSGRPDLRAAELNVEAIVKRAGWERSRIFASIMPALSTKRVGDSGIRSGPGIQLEIPLFHRNQGAISRADAEVERAMLQYLALRDLIELEVRDAALRAVQASESLKRVRSNVIPIAKEEIQLAENAYSRGNISYLNVLEATRQLYDALLREAEASGDVLRAQAELARGIGK